MPNNLPSLPYGPPKSNANEGAPKRTVSDVLSAENIAKGYADIDQFIARSSPQIEAGILADQRRRANEFKINNFMPQGSPISGHNVQFYQNELIGNAATGPNPAYYQNTLSHADRVQQSIEMTKWKNQFNVDPLIKSRLASFDGSRGINDFNRFSTHPLFKSLGFSPYRDNESLYNKNATWFDDFRRMTSHLGGLIGHGFMSAATNWSATNAGDIGDALEQETLIRRASSTKDDFGAKVTNFFANAGYTIGIGAEILAENVLLKIMDRFVPGSSIAAAPKQAFNFARFTKSLGSLFNSVKKVNDARSFWNAGRLAESALKGAANLIPGYETASFLYKANKTGTALNRLNTFSKVKGTFGAFYRDAREINLVTSEARLEGGSAQISFTQKAIEEFRKKNGRFPNANEAAEINALGTKANFDAGYQNMAAIYLSNKLMFGDMLKGIPGARRLMNKNALNSTLFKIVNNPNWKKAGLAGPVSYVKKGLFGDIKRTVFSKSWLKSIPSQMGNMFTAKALTGMGSRITGRGFRYFAGNITEGLQEVSQEAVQEGVTDYYLKEYFADLYDDPLIAANNSMTGSLLKGLENQMSGRGLEVFLNGFFMGGVMQTGQTMLFNPTSRLLGAAGDKIFKKTDYADFVAQEKARFEAYVTARNDIAKNTQEYVTMFEENLKQQKDLRNLNRMYEGAGETADAESARQDAMYKHIYTMLQTGHYDVLMDALDDFSELSEEELNEAFPDDVGDSDLNKKTKVQRLQNVKKYAAQIKRDYEDSLKIENPYNPDVIDRDADPEGYADELLGYKGFEFGRSLLVFNKFTAVRTLERMTSLFNNHISESGLANESALDMAVLFDYHGRPEEFAKFKDTLKREIEALSLSTNPSDKSRADLKKNQLDSIQNLFDRLFEYRALQSVIFKAGSSKDAADKVKSFADDIRKDKIAVISKDSTISPDGKIQAEKDLNDISDDVLINQYLKEIVYDSYKEYVSSVYDVNGITVEEPAIEKSFESFFDFQKLSIEHKRIAGHLSLLSNPLSLLELSQRYKDAGKKINEEYVKRHTAAYEKFVTYLSENSFLQKLDDMSIYFNPDAVEDFLKDDILPDAFLDKESGKVIKPDDPRYDQIIELIDAHELETGKTFKNRPRAFTPAPAPAPAAGATAGTTTPPPAPVSPATPPTSTPTGGTSTSTVEEALSAYSPDIQKQLKDAYDKSGVTAPITEWIKTSPKAAAIIKGKGRRRPSKSSDKISETNPKTITEKLIQSIYKIFRPFFNASMAPKYVLNTDQSAYINSENPTEEIQRVSTIKGIGPEDSLILRRQSSRGNIIDERLRAFAMPITPEGLSLKDLIINAQIDYEKTGDPSELDIVRGTLRNYVAQIVDDGKKLDTPLEVSDGFVDQFTQILEDLALEFRDYTWYTSMPAMVGNFLGTKYAGTVDLILEKNGKYTIVDFKTSEIIRRSRPSLYKISDQIQQNAYREAFLQNTGEDADMAILNFVITTANDKKQITSIKLDKYKNTSGDLTVLVPVKKMSVLEAKIEQLNTENSKEKKIIDNNTALDSKTKAELKKALDDKYAAEIKELELRSKGEEVDEDEEAGGLGKIETAPNPDLVKTAAKFDFTEDHVKAMSKEERELVATATSKEDVKDLVNKYIKPAPSAPTTDAKADIEAKKADIERRKKQSLSEKEWSTGPVIGAYLRQESDGRWSSMYFKPSTTGIDGEGIYGNTKEEVVAELEKRYNAELAALEGTKPTSSSESRTVIQMQPDNIEKIKAGTKTTTTRSASQAEKIGIPVGGSAVVNFGGQDFRVTNRGSLTIEEAGGKDAMLKSEGVKSESEFAYQQTKDWVNGKGTLYVYDIAPLEGKGAQPAATIKTAVPSRFAGKIIYTIPSFVDPTIFETYDVVNSDAVLKQIATDMGYSKIPGFDTGFGQIIYNLDDENRTAIYEKFKEEISKLKAEGKTIITSNFILRDLADVISAPDRSKAFDKRMYAEMTVPEKLKNNYTLKSLLEESSKKGWETTEKGLETKTKKTVAELLGSESTSSNRVEIVNTTPDMKALTAIATAYFKDKTGELREQYNVEDKDGNVRILTPEEVANMFKQRASELAAKEVTTGGKEFSKFERKIDNMLAKENAAATEPVSKEEKESLNSAAEAGRDVSDLSTEADSIINEALQNKQKKADRRNNLKDKFGCNKG